MAAATKGHSKYEAVPNALLGVVPKNWALMLERSTRIAIETAMLITSYCLLYATLIGRPHESEWIYLLAACLCPVAVAGWYALFPFKPYRSMVAIRNGMKDLDQRDPHARRLAALLSSHAARRFLLRRGCALAVLFLAPMIAICVALGKMPICSFGADCVVRIPFFVVICLLVLFRIEMLNWTITSWKDAEVSVQRDHL